MELIFYPEAAEITGATVGSVYQAVSRGALTRAGKKGRKLCLIKEQVELFKGRDISYDSLNERDKAVWQRYADEVTRANMTVVPDDIDARIARQVEQRLAKVEKKNVQREAINLFSRFLATLTEDEEQGVPQGSFFHEHPILSMVLLLLGGVAVCGISEMYAEMDADEQEEIREYLDEFDEALRLIEQRQGRASTITKIEKIHKQRARIAEFKQEIAAIAI